MHVGLQFFSFVLLCEQVVCDLQLPGYKNRYYQAFGYQGSRVLAQNQSGSFSRYVEVTWPSVASIDSFGRVWMVDRRSHQVLLMLNRSYSTTWPAFRYDYAGLYGQPGYTDGSRLQARFFNPSAIVVTTSPDADLMVYVADTDNHCIRRLTYATGRVSTLAGRPDSPGLQDGYGPFAKFFQPSGLGLDSRGKSLFVLDNGSRIRYVDLTQAMQTVVTLVGGACRAVNRWTVYDSIVLRTVGCHPDWSASSGGEQVSSYMPMGGNVVCSGHIATCGPRDFPALSDKNSPQLVQKADFVSDVEAQIG